MTNAKCKICRREGLKLSLKGNRCDSSHCAIHRKNYPPGVHGQESSKSALTGYGVQLREKQKVKRIFGLRERQFLQTFRKALTKKGPTGSLMLESLERRLDSIVYRSGFALSRSHARQLVSHGFFLVNDKKVNIPSYQCDPEDVIAFAGRKKSKKSLENIDKRIQQTEIPAWIFVDSKALTIKILRMPQEKEFDQTLNMNLIVEYFSR